MVDPEDKKDEKRGTGYESILPFPTDTDLFGRSYTRAPARAPAGKTPKPKKKKKKKKKEEPVVKKAFY